MFLAAEDLGVDVEVTIAATWATATIGAGYRWTDEVGGYEVDDDVRRDLGEHVARIVSWSEQEEWQSEDEQHNVSRLAQSIQCSARPKYPCLTTRPTRVSPAAQPRWTIPIKEGDGPVHPPHEKQGRAVEPQSRSLSSEWSAAERRRPEGPSRRSLTAVERSARWPHFEHRAVEASYALAAAVRNERPGSSMTSTWCSSRSIAALARSGSPNSPWSSSTARFDVNTMEPRS